MAAARHPLCQEPRGHGAAGGLGSGLVGFEPFARCFVWVLMVRVYTCGSRTGPPVSYALAPCAPPTASGLHRRSAGQRRAAPRVHRRRSRLPAGVGAVRRAACGAQPGQSAQAPQHRCAECRGWGAGVAGRGAYRCQPTCEAQHAPLTCSSVGSASHRRPLPAVGLTSLHPPPLSPPLPCRSAGRQLCAAAADAGAAAVHPRPGGGGVTARQPPAAALARALRGAV